MNKEQILPIACKRFLMLPYIFETLVHLQQEQETKELKAEIAKLKQSKESFEKQCKKELSKTQADSESLSRFYQKEVGVTG